MRKLPVFATVGDVWDSPFAHFVRLFPVYFASQVAILALMYFVILPIAPDSPSGAMSSVVTFYVAFFLITTAVIVFQHRTVAGAARPTAVAMPTIRYIAALILTFFVMMAAMLGLLLVLGLFGGMQSLATGALQGGVGVAVVLAAIVGFLAVFWIGIRLSLILPAVALGEPVSLRRAWNRMRGSSLRFIIAYFLLLIVMFIFLAPVMWLVNMIFGVSVDPDAALEGAMENSSTDAAIALALQARFEDLSVGYAAVTILIGYFVSVMSVSILTHTYLYLKDNWQPATTAGSDAAPAP